VPELGMYRQVEVDLEMADHGWNLIGTSVVETGAKSFPLSDKNEVGNVPADGIA